MKRSITINHRKMIGNYHLCCWSNVKDETSFMRATIHHKGKLVFKVRGTYGQFDELETPAQVQMFMWRVGLLGRKLISC